VGAALFFGGGAIFIGLLFASGGAQRSRQFAVLGQLWSGALGARRRRLLWLALGLIGTGAAACFAGVAAMDAERARRCHEYCVAAGYAEGRIGASAERDRSRRFVACLCSAPDRPTLERRADAIGAESTHPLQWEGERP
jgi:hypothetical protein